MSLQKKELASIEKSGSKEAALIAKMSMMKAHKMLTDMTDEHGEGSDEAFKADEEFKKAAAIVKYEEEFLAANQDYKKAEKEVVKEKKNKKKLLVAETRSQFKEGKDFYRFVKVHASKGAINMVKKELRASRKDIQKITKIETAKHKYLQNKFRVAMAYKKANKRLVKIVQAKFMKEKENYRKVVKSGRRRALKKSKKMLEALKAAYDKTQFKIMKEKIKETEEGVKFAGENLLLAKRDANVEEITEAKKELKRMKKIKKNDKKAEKSMTKQKIIKQNVQINVQAGKFKGNKKLGREMRRERRKFKRADKKMIKQDLKDSIQAVKDAKEEMEEAEIDEVTSDIKRAREYLQEALLTERQAKAAIFVAKIKEAKKDYIQAKETLAEAVASGQRSVKRRAEKKLAKAMKKMEKSKKKADKVKIKIIKKQIRKTKKELRVAKKLGDQAGVDQLTKILDSNRREEERKRIAKTKREIIDSAIQVMKLRNEIIAAKKSKGGYKKKMKKIKKLVKKYKSAQSKNKKCIKRGVKSDVKIAKKKIK